MTDDFESITTKLLSNGFKDILADGKVGIEKESLRVTKSKISRKTFKVSEHIEDYIKKNENNETSLWHL